MEHHFGLNDYDISKSTGFMYEEPPIIKAGGEYEIWDLALESAKEGALSLHGKGGNDGESWREGIRNMPVLEVPQDIRMVRYAHMTLSYLGHFYIHSMPPIEEDNDDDNKRIIIPKSIAVPWVLSSNILGLPPVLTYADTVLYNWSYKANPNDTRPLPQVRNIQNVTSQDIECPVTFTGTPSENHFYVTTALIELHGSKALGIISKTLNLISQARQSNNNTINSMIGEELLKLLEELCEVVKDITTELCKMRQGCNPDVFYHVIRPWFNGTTSAERIKGWYYEGVDPQDRVRVYGGPSAGQSSLVHALDAFLSIDHSPQAHNDIPLNPMQEQKERRQEQQGGAEEALSETSSNAAGDLENSREDTFMKKMMFYMPGPHREFIQSLLDAPLPVRRIVEDSNDPNLIFSFNKVIKAMAEFRSEHIRIVTRYIIQPSKHPIPGNTSEVISASEQEKLFHEGGNELKGTGGTSLVRFLKLCRERTWTTLV